MPLMPEGVRIINLEGHFIEVEASYHKGLTEGLKLLGKDCFGSIYWRPGIPWTRWQEDKKRWQVAKHHRRDVEALCRKYTLYFTIVWEG